MPSPTTPRGTAALTVRPAHDLTGYIPDTDVTTMATDDGAAEFGKASAWGENRDPHGINLLRMTAWTALFLVGHHLLGAIGIITARIARRSVEAPIAIAAAIAAVHRRTSAQLGVLVLLDRIRHEGLAEPRRGSALASAAIRVPLFFGELGLVAAAMQVYGLSDHPLVGGVHLTDDLHIAALATIVVLNVLGEVVGMTMRRIGHALQLRHRAPERDAVRGPSPWDIGLAVVVLGIAFAVLWGLAAIRLRYMQRMGEHVGAAPFFCVQMGILVAAVVLGYVFHHPLGREWWAADRARRLTERVAASAIATATDGAREIAADIDTVGTTIGTSVQHVRATAMHVEGQTHRYARDMQHGQPEPTTERLLPGLTGVVAGVTAASAAPVPSPGDGPAAGLGSLVVPVGADEAAVRERLLGGTTIDPAPVDLEPLTNAIDEGAAIVRAVEAVVLGRAAKESGLDLASILERMGAVADRAEEPPASPAVLLHAAPSSPVVADADAAPTSPVLA